MRYPEHPLILVVNTDAHLRNVSAGALLDDGYRVALAESLDAARTHLGNELPELMLLDTERCPAESWALLHLLRERDASVPVVVISTDAESGQEAVALGAAGYLARPHYLDDLLLLVERLTGRFESV